MKPSAITRRAALQAWAFGAFGKASGAHPDLRTLAPPAESIEDGALKDFLHRLRAIADSRDSRALESLMTPTFRVDFDAGKGPAAFRRRWAPESHESPVWPVLQRLLRLEGVLQGASLYCCPYVFALFPLELDLLGHVVATGSDVRLLAEPAQGTATVALVSHAILPLARPLAPPVDLTAASFVEVTLADGQRCFAQASDVYSPAGYRLFFERQKDKWRWISLVCATLDYPPDLARLERERGRGRR